MEEIQILKNILPHGIGVVALLISIRYFLQQQRSEAAENRLERSERDRLFVDAIASRDKLFTDTVTVIHKENIEARATTRESMNNNTQATMVATEKLAANTAATQRVSEKLEALIAVGK